MNRESNRMGRPAVSSLYRTYPLLRLTHRCPAQKSRPLANGPKSNTHTVPKQKKRHINIPPHIHTYHDPTRHPHLIHDHKGVLRTTAFVSSWPWRSTTHPRRDPRIDEIRRAGQFPDCALGNPLVKGCVKYSGIALEATHSAPENSDHFDLRPVVARSFI